jgi:hypothetical protein
MFWRVPLSIIRSFSLCTQQRYMSYIFADSLRAGSAWNCSSMLILLESCQQTCMTYTIAVCTVKNSWWWTEGLSETCRVSFQKYNWGINAPIWFYYKKFITMHGHMNVGNKKTKESGQTNDRTRNTPLSQETHRCHKKNTAVTRNTPLSQETPMSQETHRSHKKHTSVTRNTPLSQETHRCHKKHTSVTRNTPLSQETHLCHKKHTAVTRPPSM